MQTSVGGTGLSRKKKAMNEKQQHLETLFHAVDQIKSDITLCGKGIAESKRSLFECSSNHFSVQYKKQKFLKVSYKFNQELKKLTRQVNRRKAETMLEGVTDFYVTFFPESKSVLYRIEINGRENIRGYIFLVNMTQ